MSTDELQQLLADSPGPDLRADPAAVIALGRRKTRRKRTTIGAAVLAALLVVGAGAAGWQARSHNAIPAHDTSHPVFFAKAHGTAPDQVRIQTLPGDVPPTPPSTLYTVVKVHGQLRVRRGDAATGALLPIASTLKGAGGRVGTVSLEQGSPLLKGLAVVPVPADTTAASLVGRAGAGAEFTGGVTLPDGTYAAVLAVQQAAAVTHWLWAGADGRVRDSDGAATSLVSVGGQSAFVLPSEHVWGFVDHLGLAYLPYSAGHFSGTAFVDANGSHATELSLLPAGARHIQIHRWSDDDQGGFRIRTATDPRTVQVLVLFSYRHQATGADDIPPTVSWTDASGNHHSP